MGETERGTYARTLSIAHSLTSSPLHLQDLSSPSPLLSSSSDVTSPILFLLPSHREESEDLGNICTCNIIWESNTDARSRSRDCFSRKGASVNRNTCALALNPPSQFPNDNSKCGLQISQQLNKIEHGSILNEAGEE